MEVEVVTAVEAIQVLEPIIQLITTGITQIMIILVVKPNTNFQK